MMVVVEGGSGLFPTVEAPEEPDESYNGVVFGTAPDAPVDPYVAETFTGEPSPSAGDTPPLGDSGIYVNPAQGIGPEPPGWVGPILGGSVLGGRRSRRVVTPVRLPAAAVPTLSPAVDLSNACACGDAGACLDLVNLLIDEGASLEAAQDMVDRLAATPCGGARVAAFKRLPWWAWAAILLGVYVAWEGIR